MATTNPLYAGIQYNHSNNRTHTTSEGYTNTEDLQETPELAPYTSGEVQEYYNLNPGMYQVRIDGTLYGLLIHDTLSGADRLVIEAKDRAYTVIGTVRHKLFLYRMHEGQIVQSKGHVLKHSVNDFIELLVMEGTTRVTHDFAGVSMEHPSKMEFTSIINIRIAKEDDTYEDYLFNMKNYLKSIDIGDYRVCDKIYLEANKNKALFIFKVGRLVLTGFEGFETVVDYSNDDVMVIKYLTTNVKLNSKIICSHIPTMDWEDMINPDIVSYGICAGISDETQGFWIKVPRADYPDLDSFRKELIRWHRMTSEELTQIRNDEYNNDVQKAVLQGYDVSFVRRHLYANTPVMLSYELNTVLYKHLTLDNYNINTYFNRCWIMVYPYQPATRGILQYIDGIFGLVPKDGIIKSFEEQNVESGDIAYRDQILRENDPIYDIGYKLPEREQAEFIPDVLQADAYDMGNFTVGVVPRDGIIPLEAEQALDSGNPSAYARILEENDILRGNDITRFTREYREPYVKQQHCQEHDTVDENQTGHNVARTEFQFQFVNESHYQVNLMWLSLRSLCFQ